MLHHLPNNFPKHSETAMLCSIIMIVYGKELPFHIFLKPFMLFKGLLHGYLILY